MFHEYEPKGLPGMRCKVCGVMAWAHTGIDSTPTESVSPIHAATQTVATDHLFFADVTRGLVAYDGTPSPTGRYACFCGRIGSGLHEMAVCPFYTPADLYDSPCNTCGHSASAHARGTTGRW